MCVFCVCVFCFVSLKKKRKKVFCVFVCDASGCGWGFVLFSGFKKEWSFLCACVMLVVEDVSLVLRV